MLGEGDVAMDMINELPVLMEFMFSLAQGKMVENRNYSREQRKHILNSRLYLLQ